MVSLHSFCLIPFVLCSTFYFPLTDAIPLHSVIQSVNSNERHSFVHPNILQLQNNLYSANCLSLASTSLHFVGSSNTILQQSPNTFSSNAEPLSPTQTLQHEIKTSPIFLITNSSIILESVHCDLTTQSPPNSPTFRHSAQAPSLATIVGSSLSIHDCRITTPIGASPFILESDSSFPSGSDLTIVSTDIKATSNVLHPLTFISSSDFPSPYTITASSISFSSHTLISGNSLLFGLSSSHNTARSKMELSSCLLSTSLTNMTSTHNTHTPSDSRLSQTCLGVSVKESTGALQGTMIQDFNLGGSLLCQNTTFAICQTSPSHYQDDFIAKVFKSFFEKEIYTVTTDYIFGGSYGPEDIFHFWSLRPGATTDNLTPYNYSTVSTPISFTSCSFTEMMDSEERLPPHASGGGAIRHMCLSPLTISSCTFSQCNTTVGAGGAILSHVAGSDIPNLVTITSSSFTFCSALYSGGAVAFVENGVCLISKSQFTECDCDLSGGGACTYACTVTDSVFESNTAQQNSGGLNVEGNDATIRFSRFSGNSAAFGHNDTNLMEAHSVSWAVFGCRWSADGSQESQSVLFVAGSNADGDCSNESPCASLSKAINTINAAETRVLRMSSGSFGSAEIDDSPKHPRQAHQWLSSCMISVNEVDTTVHNSYFKNIKRTSGVGAAALDIKTQLPFTLRATFVRCSSLEGKAGALFFDTTDPTDPTVLASDGTFFFDNHGQYDTSAHDVFVNSQMIGTPPFSYGMGSLSRAPSILDNDGRSHNLNCPTVLAVFDDNFNEMRKKELESYPLSLSDVESIDFSDVLLKQASVTIMFNTHPQQSIAIKPVDLPSNAEFHIGAETPSQFTTIAQSGANSAAWFSCGLDSRLALVSLTIFISSSRTTAPFVLQASSSLTLSTCIVLSDGGQSTTPFFCSEGELAFESTILSDLTFNDCSCIIATGGVIRLSGQQGQVAACFSNVTSNGNGSVLNACDTMIQIAQIPFFNCHAANGGALYLHNCDLNTIASPFFDCSATQRGGAVYVSDDRDENGQLQVDPICFVRCSADYGGAFFLLNTGSRTIGIGGYPTPFMVIQREFAFPLFFDCTARVKGPGGYLDGTVKDDQITLTMFYSSNSALSEGSDFFITRSLYDSLQDPTTVFSNMKGSCWSLSGRSEKPGLNKHVAVEDHPEASFNFEIPVFAVSLYEGQRSYSCANAAYTDCTAISDYLEFIHTRTDDDALYQVPIYLQKSCYFVEMGSIIKQSVLLLKYEDQYQEPFTEVEFPEGEFSTSTDTVFFSVEEQGAFEMRDLILVWNNKHSLCQSAHPTALAKITECTFKMNITLEIPLIICQAGSLSIDHSTFTSESTPIPITSPIISSGMSSLTSNSETGGGKLTLSELTFENLVFGGSVGTIELDNMESVSLTQLTFTNVMKDGVSENATRIVVTGSELHKHIVPTSNNGFTRNDDEDLYKTLDRSVQPGSVYSTATLLIYLCVYRNETIFVGTDGRDINGCGDDKYVCHSLDIADTHLLSAAPSTISILDTAELTSALDLTMDQTKITPKGAQSTITVSSEGSLINHKTGSVSHELVLEKLKFSITSGRSSALLQSTSGSLIVSKCVFSSTSPLDSKLLQVTGGSVELTGLDLISLTFSSTLFDIIGNGSSEPTVTIQECDFTGNAASPSANSPLVCDWSSSLIRIENSTGKLRLVTFSHLGEGALELVGSHFVLTDVIFNNNSPSHPDFLSFQRNIICSQSSDVELLSTANSDSLWISTHDDSTVKKEGKLISNPFFVPSLDKNSTASFVKKTKAYDVVLKGELLIPCGLTLIVAQTDGKKIAKETPFELVSAPVDTHTETSATLSLPQTSLSELDSGMEWLAWLKYGKDGETSTFVFKVSGKQARALAFEKSLPWLIPLIVVLCVLLLLAIIAFLIWRRRRSKPAPEAPKEMVEEDRPQVEDDKIEVEHTHGLIHTHNSLEPSGDSTVTHSNETPDQITQTAPEMKIMEAVRCGEKLEMTVVREVDTLYNRLHTEQGKQVGIVKRIIQRQLALGLINIADANLTAEVLTKLSSHWVMFNASGDVCLKTQESKTAQAQKSVSQGQSGQVSQNQEGRRWMAPEVVKAEEERNSDPIDTRKAAVFSLGLVLWEIETGLVPFAEQDAINAQRQLGTGSLPNMQGLTQEMEELITQTLRVNPDDRPTLSTVSSYLNSLPVENDKAQQDESANFIDVRRQRCFPQRRNKPLFCID
ncbi:hypothetical protein BLNAU_13666 [Blattamonas nauphoetae]|uniref:Protein kinase domain-containing protein n=1 Tax=Blattamonas nauphoetae TaxID=2049346 RepID=A0ABQ9XMA4_9EUKA|nr:hypothetical protein BLNAU_13666 [Blattamonas nauphoetae]